MIQLSIFGKPNQITKVILQGHAEYRDWGKDVVCAGVSSIVFGTMNALDELAKDACAFQIDENKITIDVEQTSHDVQMILETMVIQVKTVMESYPKNVTVNRKE